MKGALKQYLTQGAAACGFDVVFAPPARCPAARKWTQAPKGQKQIILNMATDAHRLFALEHERLPGARDKRAIAEEVFGLAREMGINQIIKRDIKSHVVNTLTKLNRRKNHGGGMEGNAEGASFGRMELPKIQAVDALAYEMLTHCRLPGHPPGDERPGPQDAWQTKQAKS